MIASKSVAADLHERGWAIVESRLSDELVARLRIDLDAAYKLCRDYQVKNGVNVNTDGTVHHALVLGNSFVDLLDALPVPEIEAYFGGKFILNSFGGVINLRNKPSYVCNVHRDLRSFSGDIPLMLNLLVMLDDFTLENGATYLLSGSHRQPNKPSNELFFAGADRAVGLAGTILLFNSNLWHAAGSNTTDNVRRALTLTLTRPFMKQQLDYPRALGYERVQAMPENLKQVIGYNARIPASLDEWYQPPERRMYRSDQG